MLLASQETTNHCISLNVYPMQTFLALWSCEALQIWLAFPPRDCWLSVPRATFSECESRKWAAIKAAAASLATRNTCCLCTRRTHPECIFCPINPARLVSRGGCRCENKRTATYKSISQQRREKKLLQKPTHPLREKHNAICQIHNLTARKKG
jgi:hypothetical protein